jgi:hypothetical protein
MERIIKITDLMNASGIAHSGSIVVTENMSGLESNPKDDWLFLCLLALKDLSQRTDIKISSIANIGSGNGIDIIAELMLFKNLSKIIVTDVIEEILPQIRKNIESNLPEESKKIQITYVAGRDCEPVKEKVDLIYGNLPLIMVSTNELDKNRATTTLTEASHYLHLSQGSNDILQKYSLLSQLGFLLSAKEKLQPKGIIITLLGGRIPQDAINEVFQRAGLKYKELYCAFKIQADPEFLEQYAKYETKEQAQFFFYDYEKASKIIKDKLQIVVPDIIKNYSGEQLKELLKDVRLNANQAYAFAKDGKPVGHIAFAFEATIV